MKNLLFFLFISIINVSYSQIPSKEEVYELIVQSNKRKTLDTLVCDRYYTAAIKDIERENLEYLAYYYLNYYEDTLQYFMGQTEWHWLENNTPFVQTRKWYDEDSLIFSDCLPNETACYQPVVLGYKDSIYGKNFTANIIKKADSLKKINMGYYAANTKKKDIETILNKKSRFAIDFDNLNEIIYNSKNAIRADIYLDKSGEISSVYCWYTHKMQGPFRRSIGVDNLYVIEINRLLKKIGGFEPAKYNNKNIKGSYSIYFPFTENK